MGTKERRELEKQNRKQQIMNGAKDLFLSKSLGSVRIEDIAQKTELSVGTIYQYFKSKEELFVSLNLSGLRRLRERAQEIAEDPTTSTEEKILRYKDAMYETYTDDPVALQAVIHGFLEESAYTIGKELLKEIIDLGRELQAIVASIYEEGVRQGQFKKGHAVAHSDIIWGMFLGIMLWEEAKRRFNPEKDFLKSTLDRAYEVFCGGVRADDKIVSSISTEHPKTRRREQKIVTLRAKKNRPSLTGGQRRGSA
jgi:AcrR family transcriptional regulator